MIIKIFKILSAKKIFKSPPKCKLLALDNNFKEDYKKLLGSYNYSILDIRYKEIYVSILLKLLFSKKKNTFLNYVLEYIKETDCEVILTMNDNLSWYYKLKTYFPGITVFSIQNGYRNKYFFKKLHKDKPNQADYIFTFNESYSNLFNNCIKSKTVCLGSFKNNSIKKKKIKKNKSILFVPSGYEEENKFYHRSFYKPDTLLLKNLYIYCEKNNLKLEIAGKYYHEKKELNFYRKILKNENFKYHFNDKQRNIYSLSDRMLATICSHSTFGLESLARGNRTALFNNKTKIMNGSFNIFWYLKISKRGYFWSNTSDRKEIMRVLNFVIFSKENTWRKKTAKIIGDLMHFDSGNNKLKKVLNLSHQKKII